MDSIIMMLKDDKRTVLIVDWDRTMAPGVPPGKHFMNSEINPPYEHMKHILDQAIVKGWRVCILTNRMDTGTMSPSRSIGEYFTGVEIYTGTVGGRKRTHGGSTHKEDSFRRIVSNERDSRVIHFEDDLSVLRMGIANAENFGIEYIPVHITKH